LRGLSWLLFLAMPWACVWAESILGQSCDGIPDSKTKLFKFPGSDLTGSN
jgi:hypothetical protein